MLDIKFPDGSVKQFENGITPFEIAKSISNSLAKSILSASFNETTIELSTKLNENGNIKFFTWDNDEGKKAFWHSTAHILAQVILEFYLDKLVFLYSHLISEDQWLKILEMMKKNRNL